MDDRVRIVYDVPDVEKYLQLELEDTRKSAAVTGEYQSVYEISR